VDARIVDADRDLDVSLAKRTVEEGLADIDA
jgi:hypothetical protein